ncbi:toll/interleukin-1 receptor domain-containing protein [uncultured Kriegella sp.]|uniref:toll/interleukin-1 receptor domain-containing protein n=1 Tax=uncultured Kriegella sp. TaxID=1798910 RepID=UPI0030D8FA91|tara:strand:+ start:162447 stop:163433 length:987 start_codon:yes stop_codon:yes gene_type:complete
MKIFVTYSRSSQREVASLVRDLEELGHEVWFDRDISGGQSWWNNILSQIRDCEIYVFAIAKDAIDSTACIRELKYAEALGKAPLPVLIKNDVSLALAPRYISNVQYADYTKSDQKNAIIDLIKSLNGIKPITSLPDPLPEPPEIPISYLDTLKEKVDAPKMSRNEQISLVKTLQSKLDDPQVDHEDIRHLLQRLRKHDDLLFATAKDIDALLERTTVSQPKQKITRDDVKKPGSDFESPLSNTDKKPVQHRTVVSKDTTQQPWNIGLVILLGIGTLCLPFIGIIAGIIALNTKENKTAGAILLILGIIVGIVILLALIGGAYDDPYYY